MKSFTQFLCQAMPLMGQKITQIGIRSKIFNTKHNITSDNWIYGTCDCADGFKLFVCEHMVGIALRKKVAFPPPEAKTIPIGQKRKPGRPSKPKPALQKQ